VGVNGPGGGVKDVCGTRAETRLVSGEVLGLKASGKEKSNIVVGGEKRKTVRTKYRGQKNRIPPKLKKWTLAASIKKTGGLGHRRSATSGPQGGDTRGAEGWSTCVWNIKD